MSPFSPGEAPMGAGTSAAELPGSRLFGRVWFPRFVLEHVWYVPPGARGTAAAARTELQTRLQGTQKQNSSQNCALQVKQNPLLGIFLDLRLLAGKGQLGQC